MNFGEGDYVMTNTPATLQEMARQITAMGVRPEIEAFDTGHLWQAKSLVEQGCIEDPVMIQLCMGIPWGAPADVNTFMAMVNNIPDDWTFSAFSIGRMQLQYVALAAIAGGNVRVGLEDNLYLDRGELATNAGARRTSSADPRRHEHRPQVGRRSPRRTPPHQTWVTPPRPSPGPEGTRTMVIERAAVVGCGVIGAAWVARMRLRGVDVAVFDPAPRVADVLDDVMRQAVAAWDGLGLVDGSARGADRAGLDRRCGRTTANWSRSACPNGSI